MKPQVEAIEYDKKGDVLEVQHFPTVEKAFEWCESRSGKRYRAADTNFGFQLMTEEEWETLSNPPAFAFPDRWYEVHGSDENGEIRELEDSDYESDSFWNDRS